MTGNEHDEFGLVSTDPGNRVRMVQKRQSKLQTMQADLPRAVSHGIETADIGFIGVGMIYGVILEAMDILAARGVPTQYHQLRTLWPMLEETAAFTRRCPHVFVVEYNVTGQLAKLIVAQGGMDAHLHSVLTYDGVPLRAQDLVQEVVETMGAQEHKVA